jgi:serralysin
MSNGSIAQAIKLVNSAATTDSTFTYYFAASLPQYVGSNVGTGLFEGSTDDSGFHIGNSEYLISSSDFTNITSIAEQPTAYALSYFNNVSNVSFTYSNSESADIVISGLSVNLYGYNSNNEIRQPTGFTFDSIGSNPLRSDVYILQSGMNAEEIQKTIPHELLHSLGLLDVEQSNGTIYSGEENTNKYTIMSYNQNTGTGQRTHELQIYDIAAIQSIYGRNDDYNQYDTIINSFIESLAPFLGQDRSYSIWDGGGIDTIDAHGLSTAALIDLRPGYFSSIGNNTGVNITGGGVPSIGNIGELNISIAYGAYIENAIGTDNNDLLIGNLLSNHLEGGDGNDVLLLKGTIRSTIRVTGLILAYHRVLRPKLQMPRRISKTSLAIRRNSATYWMGEPEMIF